MALFKFLKNKKGVSLIQVLIASGIASIISLGVVQMLENGRRAQRRIQLLATLQDIKVQMETLIRDQAAFNQTILFNTGSPYTELKSGSLVSELVAPATSPVKLVLYDASGEDSNKLDLLGPSDTTGNGFTDKGTRCTTFNSVNGDDRCPISYRIMMAVDCPITYPTNETSCRDPQLKIVARLVYNPSRTSGNVLQTFDNLIAQTTGSDITSDTVGKYDVLIKRTASSISRGFKISAYVQNQTSYPCNIGAPMNMVGLWGAGPCNSAALTVHPTSNTFGWSKDSDPHTLTTTVSTTTGANRRFRFNEIGSYICSVQAKAFDCDGLVIELYNESGATSVALANTVAPGFSDSEARLDTTFNVGSTADNYIIRQKCDRPSAANIDGLSDANCRLGFGTAAHAPLTVTCTKMDEAF